eukprot:6205951-Pleurochrysis_carterae.AAC.1
MPAANVNAHNIFIFPCRSSTLHSQAVAVSPKEAPDGRRTPTQRIDTCHATVSRVRYHAATLDKSRLRRARFRAARAVRARLRSHLPSAHHRRQRASARERQRCVKRSKSAIEARAKARATAAKAA